MNTLQTIAGCGVALAVGVLVGSHREAPVAHGRLPIPEAAPARAYDDTFAKTIRDAKGAERWLALLSEAEQATAADLPGLIRIAGADDAMLRMLAARWAELDPKHMLNSLYADALLPADSVGRLPGGIVLRDVLLEEWTKRDLAGAIAALNDVPAFSLRDFFRLKLADAALQSEVERGLGLMSEWKITNFIPDLGKVSAWAARDPRHAAEVVMPLRGFYGGPAVLKEVGKAWAAGNPGEGLQFAATLAPGARASLGGEIIGRWAERDLAAAVAFADAQPDAMRAALAAGLVGTWSKRDPAAALIWSHKNLKGAARDEVIGSVVSVLAEKDLPAAGRLVAGMEAGAAQDRATAAIFETWFKKGGSERAAAFEWLAAVPDEETRRAAFARAAWNWPVSDPAEARDFIAGPHGDIIPDDTVQWTARMQAMANPEATMAWAGGLPAGRRESARRAALEGWVQVRPEGAITFTRALPAGPERTSAIETVSQSLAARSPEQAVQWLRDLPPAEQKIAREIFDRANLADDKRRLLDKALESF